MFKYTCKYVDFNGVEREEDNYFNLSNAELIEAQLTRNGYAEMLQRISKAVDGPAIMREFKNLVLSSYGIKSDDGRKFMKSEELKNEFFCSRCYDELFQKMIGDENFAAEFVKHVLPSEEKPLLNDHKEAQK